MTQSNQISLSVISTGEINIAINDDNSKAVYDTLKEWTEMVYGPLKGGNTWDNYEFNLDDLLNESKKIKRDETINKLLDDDDIQSKENDK